MHAFLRRKKSFFSILLSTVLLMVWLMPGFLLPVNAAVTQLDVKYRFDATASAHELYWNAPQQPGLIRVSWHDASGNPISLPDQISPDNTGTPNPIYRYVTESGIKRIVLRLPFLPDHIYDVLIRVYSDAGITQTGEGKPYVLTGMTFEGESFDQMANILVEKAPILQNMNGGVALAGFASKVISGQNPKIRLRWKVPTVYTTAGIHYITQHAAGAAWKTALQKNAATPLPILESGFYFTMNKGRNTTVAMEFKTYYNGSVLTLGGATIGSAPPVIQGLDAAGIPTPAADGYASVILEKTNGIESGTEYQNMKMGVSLATTAGAPLLFINTALVVGNANAFPVVNTDIAFEEYGALSSVFTPMEYEIAKVDVDKVEVKFRKVTNGVYTKLFYEIQDLSANDLNFPNAPAVRGNWVTIPNSSLPGGQLYGSVILPFTVVNGQLPERYIRVICSEEGAALPRNSSLANSLTLLGGQTGRPALPQNIKVEAKYNGLKTVQVNGTGIEIPTSKLVLSFDKPSIWSTYNGAAWTNYQSVVADTDPVYNLLLSTLYPDIPDAEIVDRSIQLQDASNTVTVQEPVRQKRTLVIGKQQLYEPNGDPNRLECELDGTLLFKDFASDPDVSLTDAAHGGTGENNETGTRGPYPTFLLPNTTYYLQAFTARTLDLPAINTAIWADRGNGGDGLPANLKEVISYTSPIFTFTTYPIREVPVPLPNFALSIAPAFGSPVTNPETGKMTLAGLDVTYDHILKEVDWKRYLSTDQWNLYNGRILNAQFNRRVSLAVQYRFSIAKVPPASEADFFNAGSETVVYPFTTDAPVRHIRSIPDADPDVNPDPGSEKILPNTTYYVKAHPYLLVSEWADGAAAPVITSLGNTLDTAVKSITTPKLDLISLDGISRNPRAPTEFSVASGSDGLPLLTDASVVMQWMHKEEDVGYEMMVTSVVPDPDSDPDDYASDTQLLDFLAEYRTRTPNLVSGNALYIPLNVAASRTAMANGLNLTLNADTLAVLFPMDGFLEPNTQYYFSLRAVRSRGTLVGGLQTPPPSRWMTIPVTTPTVKAPELFEVLRDIEVGFTVSSTLPKGDPSNFEVYMKQTLEPDTAYKILSRDKYSLIRNGDTYYWRIRGLASDTWYDFRLRHIPPDAKWYDAGATTPATYWKDAPGKPITRRTRDALHEVEVRFEGEDAYQYFLEARRENEVAYTKLIYSASGISDVGFEDAEGHRTQYYTERTNAQIQDNPNRYMVYARISRMLTQQKDGSFERLPLVTNSIYYVRLWARNPSVAVTDSDMVQKADSLHVGPVSTRTDFSQTDYDREKDRENIVSLYDAESESLSKKPYWVVDKGANNAVRVLLKGDRVQAMLESDPGASQVIALDAENDHAALYEVTVPEQVLGTIHRVDGKLLIRIGGAEYLISKGSFDLQAMKQKVASSQVKETMLRIRVQRLEKPSVALSSLYSPASKTYVFSAETIGSRYGKGSLETIVHDILQNPTAKGPFRYGLLDRERDALDKNAVSFTYKIHTDLLDTVGDLVSKVEGEMSRYLKDLLDGGSGVASFAVQKANIEKYPGGVLWRLQYNYDNGRILPLILPAGTSTWKEPTGMRAFTDSLAAFRVDGPHACVIASTKNVQGLGGTTWPGLTTIAGRYDLAYAFGVKPIYPTNTVTGQEAVLLYELLTETTGSGRGLTMSQKIAATGLKDVVQTRTLLSPMDKQRGLSWTVLLYSKGIGEDVNNIKPVKTPAIANLSQVLPNLQKPVVIGLDLGMGNLDSRKQFDVSGKESVGNLMEMVQKAFDLLGK